MHFPTPLRLVTFAASILLRAVLVNHVAAWLQSQGVESTIRAAFMRQCAEAPRATHVAVDRKHWVEQAEQGARGVGFGLRLLHQDFPRLSRGDDGNACEAAEQQKIIVAGNQQIGARGPRTGQHRVIVAVARHRLRQRPYRHQSGNSAVALQHLLA